MSRAEEDDDEHNEDENSERDSLPSGFDTISKDDIKLLMSGVNMVVEDLKSMKEKQKQLTLVQRSRCKSMTKC